jgi:hypothetical protein
MHSRSDAVDAVRRLGAIGDHDWWHCRLCGAVWTTDRSSEWGGTRREIHAEARRHLSEHAPHESSTASWTRAGTVGLVSGKHR